MTFLFLDTSAFVKLYLKEKGSRWIRNLIKNNQKFISELTLAETTNTTTRLFRDSLISRRKVTSVLTSISNLNSNFEIIPLEIENQLGKIASLGLSLPPN
jgi:predicted nucleic acid-binding protein